MAIQHSKAAFRLIAALTLFSIGTNQQIRAIGFADQQTTTGNKVQLAAAALSGPVSMAAIAYPDSSFLGCTEHILKAIDEFMAMTQYGEFHPSLIGWFCYDVYHAFASLQGPATQPAIDTDIANQLATFEAENTDKKEPIVLSDSQRSSIKQFIRYILAGAEASTRVIAACNNEQATTAAHKNYLWDSRGLLHSLTSLSRLANYYLETENDDRKAILLVLIIINTVGSVGYAAGQYDAHTAYTNEQQAKDAHPTQAQTTTPGTTTSTTQDTNTTKTPTPQTTGSQTATTDKPVHSDIPNLETSAIGQDVLATITTQPDTATATATDQATTMATSIGSANATPLPLTASALGSATTSATATSRFARATDRTTGSVSDEKQSTLETKQPSPLDIVRAHRPQGTKNPDLNHDDLKATILAYQQQPRNSHYNWNDVFGFIRELHFFCQDLAIEPFFKSLASPSEDKNAVLIRKHWQTTPLNPNASAQEVEQFCRSFQTFCEQEQAREHQVATLLAQLHARRPSDSKDAAFNHEDLKSALQAYCLQDHSFWWYNASNVMRNLDNICLTGRIKPLFEADLKTQDLFKQHWEKTPLRAQPSPEEVTHFCQSFQAFCVQAAENEQKGMLPLEQVKTSRPNNVAAREFNQTDFERTCQAFITARTYDNYEHSYPQRNPGHFWGYSFTNPEDFINWFNYFCDCHDIQFFFHLRHGNNTGHTTYNAKRYNKLFAQHWYAQGDANPFCEKPSARADITTFCQAFATRCAEDDKIMQAQETLLEQVRKARPYHEGEPTRIEQAPFNPQDIEAALTAFAMECNKEPRRIFYGLSGMMQPFDEFCLDRGIASFMLFNHSLNGELLRAALRNYWDSPTNPFTISATRDADIKTFCEGFRQTYAPIQKRECAIYALVKDIPRNEAKTPLSLAEFKKVCEAFKKTSGLLSTSFHSATGFAKGYNDFCEMLDIPVFFTKDDPNSREEKDEKGNEFRKNNTDILKRFWAFKGIENPFNQNNDGETTVQSFCDQFETFYLDEQKKAAAREQKAADEKRSEEERIKKELDEKEAAQRIREEADFKTAQEMLLEPLRKSRPLDAKGPDVTINFKELEPALEAFQAYRKRQAKSHPSDSHAVDDHGYREFLEGFNTFCSNSHIQPFFASSQSDNVDLLAKYWGPNQHNQADSMLTSSDDDEAVESFCQGFESFCARQRMAKTRAAQSEEAKASQPPTSVVAPTTPTGDPAPHTTPMSSSASVLNSGSASAMQSANHAPVSTSTRGDSKQSHEVKQSKAAAPESPLVAISARRPLGSRPCMYYNYGQWDAASYTDFSTVQQEYHRLHGTQPEHERAAAHTQERAFNQFCRDNDIEPYFLDLD